MNSDSCILRKRDPPSTLRRLKVKFVDTGSVHHLQIGDNWRSSRTSYDKTVVRQKCAKHVPTNLTYYGWVSLPYTGFKHNSRATREILPPYSINNTRTRVFKHRKSQHIFCSYQSCFRAVKQHRPHCCRIYQTVYKQIFNKWIITSLSSHR